MCTLSVARPHSQVVSPSKYPPYCLWSLLHLNPVRSWFRHLHVVHGLSYPLARLSLRLTVTLCGVGCNLLSHSFHRMTLGDNSDGFTLRKKQFLDLSLISAVCCPYREWASLVSCLVFSILAHTYLRMSVGTIPARKYRASTLVGFMHHVTALHTLVSSIFSFLSWGDLAHTDAAYCVPQSSLIPMLLFWLYLHLLPILNLTTFLIDCSVLPHSSSWSGYAVCSLTSDQD